ncbi:MAG: hypothetical protein OEM77_03480 [Nitrosopumilus sp.]|nr:hypothetical protein [Nitrosopumilus sp.]MDH3736131.1 hypothetical protein [Nitrosopumilus sp.]MDH3822552.1 hypothetical protein [Nitrosopumilus sp.]MDH3833290.1 hypothetical protein [Nitrosopumilus sp.]
MIEKKSAIKSLEEKISKIDQLHQSNRFSAAHTKWVSDALYFLEDVFGRNSRIFITFAGLKWQAQGSYITRGFEPQDELEQWMHKGYLDDLEIARGLLQSGIEQINLKGIENVYQGKDTPKESSEIVKVINLIENQLRKLVRNVPQNEKAIQESLENLFIGAGLDSDYSREKERITYSSKTYIPDFVFNRISTAIEVKFCNSSAKEKEIIDEINADIVAYKTKYSNLIFVIYDLGNIRDQDQFRSNLEENENVIIRIIKH